MDEAQRKKEIDFLGFEISQIMEAQLEKGEDEVLEEAYKRMANSKKITGNLEETHQYLSGMPESASELLDAVSDAWRNLFPMIPRQKRCMSN